VRIEILDLGRDCLVTVSDGGPGITPEDRPLLFHRFYKPDRSRTRGRGGVGLGLAIALENARLLKGSLEISSESGRTSFTLRLARQSGSGAES
jgi:two-component system OmpR family sensor kinase